MTGGGDLGLTVAFRRAEGPLVANHPVRHPWATAARVLAKGVIMSAMAKRRRADDRRGSDRQAAGGYNRGDELSANGATAWP